jgi:hypothetical protein
VLHVVRLGGRVVIWAYWALALFAVSFIVALFVAAAMDSSEWDDE